MLLKKLIDYAVTTMFSTDIWEEPWDVCIVLDDCRYDAALSVTDEIDWLSNISKEFSVASTSIQWYRRTLKRAPPTTLESTSIVTANPFSTEIDEEEVGYLHEVWKDSFDKSMGTVPPRPVTDAAIKSIESNPNMRQIIHYMQPHFPIIGDKLGGGFDPENGWEAAAAVDRIKTGELKKSTVWEGYIRNLRIVLEDVKLLVENVPAENFLIMSDHGELFGEANKYGHGEHQIHPKVREVPWWKVKCSKNNGYVPNVTTRSEPEDRESQLRALGYIE